MNKELKGESPVGAGGGGGQGGCERRIEVIVKMQRKKVGEGGLVGGGGGGRGGCEGIGIINRK